ncbi:MAG: hypothetical protein J6C64_05990 [Lachnospiraceae bacterium]|nr:hypothetical protein [Lachnospiraceae bacterium]
MILVDIYVPAVNEIYDFELNENLPAGDLIPQIAALTAKQENMEWNCDAEMHLYAFCHGGILNQELSLKRQGVKSGERLILF